MQGPSILKWGLFAYLFLLSGVPQNSSQADSLDQITSVLGLNMSRYPKIDKALLATHLNQLCQKYSFDPIFILSVIEVESQFRPAAVSPKGAVGLMQIMPSAAQHVEKQFGISGSLRDPFANLSIGIAYLSLLKEKYRYDSQKALLAAYNLGPSRFDSFSARKIQPHQTLKYIEAIGQRMKYYRTFFLRGSSSV